MNSPPTPPSSTRHLSASWSSFAVLVTAVVASVVTFWVYRRSLPIPVTALLGALTAVVAALAWRLAGRDAHHRVLIQQLESSLQAAKTARRDLDAVVRDRQRVEQELNGAREAAERALKVKSEFMANMSHEIRTPMNGVLGMTELLLGTELNRKQRHFAETIRSCGEQLLALINDVLDLSKIEAGKLQLNEAVFDLRQLLEDVNDIFAEQAHRKHLDLTCLCPPDIHTAVRGDAFRIKQVLVNLVGNAVKFTDQGEVVTRVLKVGEEGARLSLRVEVSDTGIGIRAEAIPRLFTAFSQADSSTTRQYGGTRLGLAICAKLVQLLGGDIGCRSEYGRGSTFWFTVALEKAAAGALPVGEDTQALNGLRVLIVDAHANSRTALMQQLQAWGMTVQSVHDGRTALAALQSASASGHPFDVAIVDHGTPGLNIMELAHNVKANRGIAEARLIMLTAIGNLENTGQWLAAGVDAYVDKPVRQLELQRSLLRVLGRSRRAAPAPAVASDAEECRYEAHVLVAEDNPVNQELITAMLEGFGCRVRVVANGREVVEAVTDSPLDLVNDPYHLVLMDCQMPLMDGYAATAAIRKWEKAEKPGVRTPIVALTANALEGDRERCLAAGMDDYLAKPLGRAQLAEALKRWLPMKLRISARVSSSQPAVGKQIAENERKNTVPTNVLDMDVLARIRALQRQGGPDILTKVVGLYLDKSPELLAAIRKAVGAGDAHGLRNSAHSLKSSSANLGATKVAALSAELEGMGRDARLDNAAVSVDVLEYEHQLACEALRSLLAKAAA